MGWSHPLTNNKKSSRGQLILELILAMGLSAIMLPALLVGLVASRGGKAQQLQRMDAISLTREAYEAIRVVRERGWSYVSANGTYYLTLDGDTWILATGSATISGFMRYVTIDDVFRDINGY